jgi:hypothetical protein
MAYWPQSIVHPTASAGSAAFNIVILITPLSKSTLILKTEDEGDSGDVWR